MSDSTMKAADDPIMGDLLTSKPEMAEESQVVPDDNTSQKSNKDETQILPESEPESYEEIKILGTGLKPTKE